MQKIIVALGLIFFVCLVPYSTASAGSINSYEQEVISYAQGTFEYKGELYKVDPYYINLLKNYLESDNVDMTARQRDKVFSIAGNYIETGVLGGYLVPVGGGAPIDKEPDSEDATNADSPEDTSLLDGHTEATDKANIDRAVDSAGADASDKTDSFDEASSTLKIQNNVSETGGYRANEEDSLKLSSKDEDLEKAVDIEHSDAQSKTTSLTKLDSKSSANYPKQDIPENNEGDTEANTDASKTDSEKRLFIQLLDLMLSVDIEAANEPAVDGNTEFGNKTTEAAKKPVVVHAKNVAVSDNAVILGDIIKNTDNNLHITFIVLLILGFLFMAGILMTIKLTYRNER